MRYGLAVNIFGKATMKFRISFLLLLCLVGLISLESPTALGQQSILGISHSVSGGGTTVLTISGFKDTCTVLDGTNFVIAQNVITIHTSNHGVPCIPVPSQFFSVTVDVGVLPSGHYSVIWLFDAPLDQVFQPTSIQFDAALAATQPIPAVGMSALLLLFVAIALFGMYNVRKRDLLGKKCADRFGRNIRRWLPL